MLDDVHLILILPPLQVLLSSTSLRMPAKLLLPYHPATIDHREEEVDAKFAGSSTQPLPNMFERGPKLGTSPLNLAPLRLSLRKAASAVPGPQLVYAYVCAALQLANDARPYACLNTTPSPWVSTRRVWAIEATYPLLTSVYGFETRLRPSSTAPHFHAPPQSSAGLMSWRGEDEGDACSVGATLPRLSAVVLDEAWLAQEGSSARRWLGFAPRSWRSRCLDAPVWAALIEDDARQFAHLASAGVPLPNPIHGRKETEAGTLSRFVLANLLLTSVVEDGWSFQERSWSSWGCERQWNA
ncbi:hypothetical protein BJ912DRAFT_1149971 [Pholiota molesta]|nr:hypothetical protein BJ912DRAFT_1149971 [Pholiota molesta]